MMRTVSMASVVLLLCAGLPRLVSAQTNATTPASHAFFTVAVYDTSRNPVEDLAATVARAQAEDKRILLDVGGEWCSWCHALDRYIDENEAVAAALARDFLIMKVNYSPEHPNEAFLADYPTIPGYPHFFVLEQDGSFLHSQGTGDLEEGKSYNEEAFLAFLSRWAPAR